MNPPHWIAVTSSNIEALALDPSAQRLSVKFKGGKVYAYENVSVAMFELLTMADSVGKAFQQHIKAQPERHPFSLVH